MFSTVFGPPPITSPNYATDKNIEIKHKRFAKLLDKSRTADEGIKFMVNQLAVNKSVYDDILSKTHATEVDRTHVDLFHRPIQGLMTVLVSDEKLRNELDNYNNFLRVFYKTKIREKINAMAKYTRNTARTTTKASKANTTTKAKFMKLGMSEAQANAEIAKIRGFASVIVPTQIVVNPDADAAVDARVNAALNALLAKLNTLPMRSDISRIAQASRIALASALNQYNRRGTETGANSMNSEVNAYLANLQAQETARMMATMPVPPTHLPKGGKRKAMTRKGRNVNKVRKTRKMRKERKV